MAMDAYNYVSQDASGNWIAVVDNTVVYQGPSAAHAHAWYRVRRGEIPDLEARLRAAGYNGPSDEASMIDAYARANPVTTPPAGGRGSGTGAGGDVGGAFDWISLWSALTSSNQQQFDEMKRQFDERMKLEGQRLGLDSRKIDEMIRQFDQTLGEQKRQFDAGHGLDTNKFNEMKRQFDLTFGENQRQFDRRQYADLAQSLLNGAIEAGKRPADWMDYAKFTSGGRDIFNALFGNEPPPAFGAPSGYSRPGDITDVLKALGITQIPGTAGGASSSTLPSTGPLTNPPQTGTIGPSTPGGENGGGFIPPAMPQGNSSPYYGDRQGPETGMVSNPVLNAGGQLSYPAKTAPTKPTSLQELLMGRPQTYGGQGQNLTPPTGQVGFTGRVRQLGPSNTSPYYENPVGDGQSGGGGEVTPPERISGPDEIDAPMAPLPHQINPAVWDKMSPTAKQMILGAAQRGRTPSGSWTPEDYLAQIERARPQGQAPKQTGYNWGQKNRFF